MSSIIIDGKEIFYEILGSGPSLLMIHGSFSTHHLWDKQHPLAKHVQLVLLDLPGHGASDSLDGEITVQRFAQLLTRFIEKLDLQQAVPVGHSLGGAIALQLALDYPSLLGGLVLVGTGAKLGVTPTTLEGLRTDFSTGVDLVIGQMGFASEADPRQVTLVKEEAKGCNPKIGYADFFACSQFDIRDRIQEIQVPTLVLVGDQDQLTPLKWSKWLATNIEKAELEIIEQAGHYVMVEQPVQVNQAIASFIHKI
ncbi:MAG: alpha/beta fold hydrolase [Promethearchaeota archaeon]